MEENEEKIEEIVNKDVRGYIKTGNLEVFITPIAHDCIVKIDGKNIQHLTKVEIIMSADQNTPHPILRLTSAIV